MDQEEEIKQLTEQVRSLMTRHDEILQDLIKVQSKLDRLRVASVQPTQKVVELVEEKVSPEAVPHTQPVEAKPSMEPPKVVFKTREKPREKTDLEKFVGQHLLSLIGVAITVIGIAFGVRYAIDHQMLSPTVRVFLGYIAGLAMVVTAFRLKPKYHNFSAVVLGGGMAALYFITYAAYKYYALMPQTAAFVMMVLFTAFTVVAALQYDRQIIAHVGMVGAYAVPFLLSDGSGRVVILFTYVLVINAGLIYIAFRKRWLPVFLAAFGLSWLIYMSWYTTSYEVEKHFGLALAFVFLFFASFYVTWYALISRKITSGPIDITILFINAVIFFGVGYATLDSHETGQNLLGLFALGNGLVHAVMAFLIGKSENMRAVFLFISALVLTSLTIAVPIQLDGNWVTLLWVAEGAILNWFATTRKVPELEKGSLVVLAVGLMSLAHDWMQQEVSAFANPVFYTGLFTIAMLAWTTWRNRVEFPTLFSKTTLSSSLIGGALILVTYFTFVVEIQLLGDNMFTASIVYVNEMAVDNYSGNYDLYIFFNLAVINFTFLYLGLLALLNMSYVKNVFLGQVLQAAIVATTAWYLIGGLTFLSELRSSFLEFQNSPSDTYAPTVLHIAMRYVCLAFAVFGLWTSLRLRKAFPFDWDNEGWILGYYLVALWVASSELIHWMDMGDSEQTYGFGLSLLWGGFAILLIALGIRSKRQYMRVAGLVLFAVTLGKLLLYDIWQLSTLARTIVFVLLGLSLLVSSFLYNRFKNASSENTPDQ